MSSSRHRIVFFGTPEFSVACLQALAQTPELEVVLVVTQPDRPAGRGNRTQPSPVKAAAEQLGIPVFQPERLKKEQAKFKELCKQADIGVVVAFGQILSKTVLDFPRKGCLNVHASLLPRWRGAAPIQRAIMSGDKASGVCLMQMDEGLDTGPVFISKEIPINPDDNCGSLHDKLATAGANLLKENLLKIITGELTAVPQGQAGIAYASKITNDECKIDWHLSSDEIALRIRALSPFPGAFSSIAGKRIKIFRAISTPELSNSHDLPVGNIACLDKNKVEVRCGKGLLSIEDIQLEGKKRMPVSEFIKGCSLSYSSIFGN